MSFIFHPLCVCLAMLMFPFAPLALIIVPLLFFLLLKWEKFVMLHLYRIPKRPWKAQKAGEVFSFFYLVSFFLVGIPSSAFFLSVTTFAKSCSIQVTAFAYSRRYFSLTSVSRTTASTCVLLMPFTTPRRLLVAH